MHVRQGGYGIKAENKLPFHQGKRRQQYSIWARIFPEGGQWERSLAGVGRALSFMETCLLCGRATGRRICSYREGRWGESVIVSGTGLCVPFPWEKGSKGYRDVHVGAGEESSKWRSVRKT